MRSHIPLMFPSSRKALWCHSSLGAPVELSFPKVSISVTEQVLFLAYGQSRSGKVEDCCLYGDIKVEPDCSEVIILLDQFESLETNNNSGSQGAFRVPTKLIRNSRHEGKYDLNRTFLDTSIMCLSDRAYTNTRVEVSEFLSASAECTLFGGTNQIHCDIDIDSIVTSARFCLTPIEAVNVAMTALSKSVLANDKHGVVRSQRKSGYLTMDQYRKVVLLLESDPKVLSVPIIGIWVSGVDLVADPYIWANCVRYMHTTQITDRVPKPLQPFLLVHKSPLMSSVQFLNCVPSSTALSYQLLSGSQGFSMAKEVTEKRRGKLFSKLVPQDLSTVKGRKFTEYIEQASSHYKENRLHTTPKSSRQKKFDGKILDDEDSLPWSSPFPYKFKEFAATPIVPEISLLDESSPFEVRISERRTLQPVSDSRLNSSLSSKRENLLMPTQPLHREDAAAVRKIEFDQNIARSSKDVFDAVLFKHSLSAQTSPHSASSLRSLQLTNWLAGSNEHHQAASHSTTTGEPTHFVNTDLKHNESLDPKLRPEQIVQYEQRGQGSNSADAGSPIQIIGSPDEICQRAFQQPFAAVTPRIMTPCHSHHTCQCHSQRVTDQARYLHTPSAAVLQSTNPLNVITDNVQRLLSPNIQRTAANAPTHNHEKVVISPIEVVEQIGQMPCDLSPLSAHRHHFPVSPEVQQILRHQESQLQALQHQIQKLLQAQENRSLAAQSGQFTDTRKVSTKCATVNTGVSLLECKNINNLEDRSQSSSNTHDSMNESSRSHSLIQHDLTTLDLPTQITARSFTSDINVDYESYDDSPTGSPKMAGSDNSDESWQSPVLGESVSMIAESMDQESTKQQLDIIIKNVRDLLAQHTPPKLQSNDLPLDLPMEQPNTDTSSFNNPPQRTNLSSPPPKVSVREKHVDALRKMGIELDTSSPAICSRAATSFPRLQYMSMMMTDSTISDSNKSLELNALALKYLQDDQLAELAQLTVHRSVRTTVHETSLLRQVLSLPLSGCQAFESAMETNNMSMASREYLKRYALTDISTTSDSSSYGSPAVEVLDSSPANNLKSILRKENNIAQSIPEQQNISSDLDESSVQVLDIARLKELPKLL